MTRDFFPWDKVKSLERGQTLTHIDAKSRRRVTYSSNHNGTFLVVELLGSPESFTISCDGDDANAIARCLVTGSFD